MEAFLFKSAERMHMSKGLSQILWLIISASVLMMLALTVVALGQGGIQSLFTQTGQTGCTQAISSQLGLMNVEETRPIPSTCFDGGEPIEGTRIASNSCESTDTFRKTGEGAWKPVCG